MTAESSLQVLIVEDDTDLAEMLSAFFRGHGLKTFLASDGQEALDILQTLTPDVIVLDIILPRIDGIELLTRIRTGDRTIPVVMLTCKKTVENILEGFTTGADDYITKPFHPLELLNRIYAVLRRYKQQNYINNAPLSFKKSGAGQRCSSC